MIAAGFIVGLSTIIAMRIEEPLVMAFLFSHGLITIVCNKLSLFTSKVALLTPLGALKVLFFNLVGIGISTIALYDVSGAIMCGVLMYTAYLNAQKNIAFVIIPVMSFILGGGLHSIRYAFTFFTEPSLESLVVLIVAILGNAAGALGFKVLMMIAPEDVFSKDKKEKQYELKEKV